MRTLSIVDEEGNIIGEDTRENIHKKGLLHKEVHVWFYTPKGGIIFQLRGKDKDTFPNLLDATVGGHVELGDDYVDTALKETLEETGVRAIKNDLYLVAKIRKIAKDPATDMVNNVLRMVYAYEYSGNIEDLGIEEGSQGFEEWLIKKLLVGLSETEKKRFIPSILENEYLEIYRKIGRLLKQE